MKLCEVFIVISAKWLFSSIHFFRWSFFLSFLSAKYFLLSHIPRLTLSHTQKRYTFEHKENLREPYQPPLSGSQSLSLSFNLTLCLSFYLPSFSLYRSLSLHSLSFFLSLHSLSIFLSLSLSLPLFQPIFLARFSSPVLYWFFSFCPHLCPQSRPKIYI